MSLPSFGCVGLRVFIIEFCYLAHIQECVDTVAQGKYYMMEVNIKVIPLFSELLEQGCPNFFCTETNGNYIRPRAIHFLLQLLVPVIVAQK